MAIRMPQSAQPLSPEKKAASFISGAKAGAAISSVSLGADEATGKAVVNMRFDAELLARVDAAAKRQGISRTAWLHVAASRALES